MTTTPRLSGPPGGSAAPELVESGFALENADAPFLHDGLNLADIAHVLDLRRRKLIPETAARDLLTPPARGLRHRCCRIPLRPGVRGAVQLAGTVLRRAARRRRRLAPRRTTPAGGRPDRVAVVRPTATARVGRRGRLVRTPRDRAGRSPCRYVDARPDLPSTGATVDVRPLHDVVRLPGDPRRPPAARRRRLGQPEPWRRRLRQRNPAAGRPHGHSGCTGLRRRHRAHAGRDVADRRPDPRPGDGGQPAVDAEQARGGPGDLVEHRVRLRGPRRRIYALQHLDAAEAQPLRAVDRARAPPEW